MSSILKIQNIVADAAAGISNKNIADAAAGIFSTMSTPKRKADDAAGGEPEAKKFMTTESSDVPATPLTALVTEVMGEPPKTEVPFATADAASTGPLPTTTKARELRLEQNRKAARESRRRKKVMIEELQRSVIFFSRANSTLKTQNDELSRMLMNAQSQVKAASEEKVAAVEEPKPVEVPVVAEAPPAPPAPSEPVELSQQQQQSQAQAVATQALFETQGFPAAAARAAAQTMNASSSSPSSLPQMQPGATMQAMANFQQAAAAAMQAAIQGMQGIPNINLTQMAAAVPQGHNAQQAYTDQMTAIAMQQAAAAQLGAQQFMSTMPPGFMASMMWPAAAQAAGMFPQLDMNQMNATVNNNNNSAGAAQRDPEDPGSPDNSAP